MKRLTLMRHAKAMKAKAGMADFDRSLNERGEGDATTMGQRLEQHQIRPDQLVSSPAQRALRTATLVAQALGYPPEDIATNTDIYEADAPTLMQVIQRLNAVDQDVMLFGHNPGLLLLSIYLTSEPIDHLPTSSIVRVEFDINTWADVRQGRGKLVLFDYPKKVD